MSYKIYKISDCSPVDLAAEELKKYLRMMMPEAGDIKIERADGVRPDGFCLGTMRDLSLDTSEAENAELDDIVHIDTTDTAGIIAGSNPRSVLIATYRFLRENGCRWLLPGVDGEYIPMQTVRGVKYHKMADSRYRGWCNEGAEFQQCLMDAIEFAPKVGLNTFSIEFFVPYFYYDSYYAHTNNLSRRLPEPISKEQVIQWKKMCEAELSKRGIQFMDVGHGWTVESFGLSTASGWEPDATAEISDDVRPYLAEVNGKREFYKGVPMNTNMCMSSKKGRELFVNAVTKYLDNHENVDIISIALADNHHNHCECAECRKKTPSDWLIVMLNDLDAEMTRRGMKSRVVFPAYYETMWPPVTERLNNEDRFILMFCPLNRDYKSSFDGVPEEARPREFRLNDPEMKIPTEIDEFSLFLREWQKVYGGSCFGFEYHFFVYEHHDMGGMYFSKRIYEDIQKLSAQRLSGYVEDGSQRCFFPNGLNMFVYANTLFDKSLGYEEQVKEYFDYAYGTHADTVRECMEALTEIFEYGYMLGVDSKDYTKGPHYDPDREADFARVKGICDKYRKYAEANYKCADRVKTVSMILFLRYLEYCEGAAEVMKLLCHGTSEEADEAAENFFESFGRHEPEMERYYDHYLNVFAWRWHITKGKRRQYFSV